MNNLNPHYLTRKPLLAAAALALSAYLGGLLPAGAQSTGATNSLDPEFVKKLLQRVDDLESQVKSLKSAVPAAPAQPETPVIREIYPKIQFNLLGDVDYHVSSVRKDKNTFAQGDVDPIVTAKLT